MVEVTYLDHSERGLTDFFPVAALLPVMRQHASMAPTIQIWLTAEQIGETRMAVGSELPRMVQTYWEEVLRQQQPIPEAIQQVMEVRAARLRRGPSVRW